MRRWEEGRGWGARLRAAWALLARSLADWRAQQSLTLGAGPDGAQRQAAHASSLLDVCRLLCSPQPPLQG